MKYLKKTLLIILLIPITAYCQMKRYSVSIPNGESIYISQESDNWCWAACNVMLLNAFGINETQSNQCMKLFGSVVDRGAGGDYELAKRALRGDYNSNQGDVKITPYVSYIGTHSDDPVIIINQLSKGIPVIMATNRHGRVCIGVDYISDGVHYQIINVKLLDPALHSSEILDLPINSPVFAKEGGLTGFMTCNVN